jgi:lipopolysaccharide transport system ATP-binding protein
MIQTTDQPAIAANGLGKMYRIGQARERYPTFRDALVKGITAPLRRFQNLSGGVEADEAFWALKDVSFEVRPGEVIGVIGRNGAGKSTLLKILSRITDPTEGQARISGRVASLLEVGTGFHPELTGRENIYLNGAILGMKRSEIDNKFDLIVEFAEIRKFLETPVKRYSSGMYVRMAFAVAAHLEPEILIVDEVLAVGDAEFQKRCLGRMKEVASGLGRTVLFVSHNMAAIRSLCSRCLVLDGGQIAFDGSPDDAVGKYLRHDVTDGLQSEVKFTKTSNAHPMMTAARVMRGEAVCSDFHYGDEIALEVDYQSPYPTASPTLGYVIYAQDGQAIINANNCYQPMTGECPPTSRGTVRAGLGLVPLSAGRYTISVWFGAHDHVTHYEQFILEFSIHQKDIWGVGKLPDREISMMWWPTQFSMETPTPPRRAGEIQTSQ